MSFDFPNSPTEGSVYAPAGGPQYTFTSGAWRMIGTPSPLVATADSYNRIVNGAMQHSQENGDTAGTTSAYFAADQWHSSFTIASGTLTTGRQQGGAAIDYNRYAAFIAQTACTFGAGNTAVLRQFIEGNRIADFNWGTANAKSAVLRFWAFATLAGTYSIRVGNAPTPPTRSFVAQFTLASNTWTPITVVIPGDTSGTWLTDSQASLIVDFVLAAGSTYVGVAGWQAGNFFAGPGQANALATTSNVFNIAKVGLYLDPNNTGVPPPWVTPDYANELLACKRYWHSGVVIVLTTGAHVNTSLPCVMRVAPAIAGGGAGFTVQIGGAGPEQSYSQTTRNAQSLIFNARM